MTTTYNEKDSMRRPKGVPGTYNHDYSGVPTISDDDPAEKPWQRVPSTLIVVVLGVYLLLGYIGQLVEDDMPSAVDNATLARDNSDTFSEDVALRYIHQIIGGAPRVAGTEFHLEKTHDMKQMVDDIAAEARLPVHTDWQMVSGDFFLERVGAPHVNFYQNCSNVIALLEGESGFLSNGTLGSSILVNCHYDSVPFALGASDNVVFCAAMLETLSKLSKRTTKLKHNVVFLFNGAEENGLQGSHAFIQHPWARGVISVINLDAAGMNGKPAVFQVTDPRIINAYSRSIYRPNAQAMGEFLFNSGIIPSDTDFRIFRDFGDIHGIDIAFSKWGHVYHTRNDRPELIQPGVVQNAGNMVLALVTDVADLDDMDHKIEPEAAMYFDYMNLFMLTYSLSLTYVVDLLIVALGFASVAYYVWLVGARWSSVKELLFSCVGRLAATVAGVLMVVVCTLLMVASTVQMRYLSHPWLVVPLYWMPFFIPAVAVSQVYDAWRVKKCGLSRSLRTVQAQAATRLLLTLVTLLLVCIPGVSTMRYLVSIQLFIVSITSAISITVLRYVKCAGWQHLVLEVSLSLPAVVWLMSLALRMDAMMLPVMGRSAGATPDYTVAMLNAGLALIVAVPVSGIELLFSRKYLWIVLSGLGSICVILMFIPFNPYDGEISLQRHYWFHSEISTYDITGTLTSRGSGVLVTRQDPYSLDRVLPALATRGLNVNVMTDFTDVCMLNVYCGMPLYRTTFGRHYENAMFIYTGPPTPFRPPASLTLETKTCSGNTCSYNFVMKGGAHNMLTFWPYQDITLTSWSLQSPVKPGFTQLDRPVYVIYHSTPTYMEEWDLPITITLDVPLALQSGPIMEVSHHSHELYHPEHFTGEYQAMIDAMPEYFNIATILSFRNNYVF